MGQLRRFTSTSTDGLIARASIALAFMAIALPIIDILIGWIKS